MVFGLWKKKKDSSDGAEEAPKATRKSGKKPAKKRPDETLASIVSESVPAPTLEMLAQNRPFALEGRGYVVGLINVNDPAFGGFNARHDKRNEEKGALAQAIKSNQVSIIATADMLENEYFALIPDQASVMRAEEYNVMAAVPYLLTVVKPQGNTFQIEVVTAKDGQGIDRPVTTSLSVLKAIAQGETSLQEAFPTLAEGEDSVNNLIGETAEFQAVGPAEGEQASRPIPVQTPAQQAPQEVPAAVPAAPEEAPAATDVDDLIPDEEPDFEDAPDFTDEVERGESIELDDDEIFGSDEDMPFVDDEDPGFDKASESNPADDYADEAEDEGELQLDAGSSDYIEDEKTADYIDSHVGAEYSEFDVKRSRDRQLSFGDLDLVISDEDFEFMFKTKAPQISYNSEMGESKWLNDILRFNVEQANAELRNLHNEQYEKLRAKFTKLMTLHAEKVKELVSYDIEGTDYHNHYLQIQSMYQQAMEYSQQELQQREAAIRADFEAEIEREAQRAAEEARDRYVKRNKTIIEETISRLPDEIQRRNEDQYDSNVKELDAYRRKIAAQKMEEGASKFLMHLTEEAERSRELVREQARKETRKLGEFLEAHIEKDLQRTKAIKTKIDYDTEIDDLKKRTQKEIDKLREQMRQREEQLQRERDELEDRYVERAEQARAQYEAQIKHEELRLIEAQQRISSLEQDQRRHREAIHDAERRGEARADAQISRLRDMNDAQSREIDSLAKSSSNTSKLMLALIIAIAVMAVLVGIIIGSAFGGARAPMSAAIVEIAPTMLTVFGLG